jgi:hypothetical protein
MRGLPPWLGRALLAAVIATSAIAAAVPDATGAARETTLRTGDATTALRIDRPATNGEGLRFAVGSSGTGSDAEGPSDPPVIDATYTFERTAEPGTVTVRVTYDVPPSISGLVIDPAPHDSDRLTVTDATGFVERSESARWRWERGASGIETPSVRMRYAVNRSSDVFGGLNFVDVGAWALLEPPNPVLESYRSRRGRAAFDRSVGLAEGETGYATPEMVYLGPYERTNGTRGGQEFVVVTPAAAATTNASAVIDTLGAANRLYDVPRRDARAVVFIGPDPLRTSGSARGDSLWVHADRPPDSRIYVHEYVHTRQEFETTRRMSWIVEAQAAYYDRLLLLYRGTTTYRRFHAQVSTARDATRRLAPANRTAYTIAADYTKGARVLAALDAKIRAASERNASLADVFRRLNRHEGRVSYADFEDAVAAVSGPRFDEWLDRHLTTANAPTVPDNQSLYAPTESGIDSDDDGLTTAAELDNGTDPFVADTDRDGVDDGAELRRGSDPLSADSPERADPTPETGGSVSGASAPGGDGLGGTAPGSDEPEDDGTSTGVALAVVGSLLAAGIFGVGAVGVGAAKLLDRRAGIEIGFLTRRSVVGLVLLSTASLAVFIGIVVFVG